MKTWECGQPDGCSHGEKLVNYGLMRTAALLAAGAFVLLSGNTAGDPLVSAQEPEPAVLPETTIAPTLEALPLPETTVVFESTVVLEPVPQLPPETIELIQPESSVPVTEPLLTQETPATETVVQAAGVLSLDERCAQAITEAQAVPVPGYSLICGPDYNTSSDGVTCSKYAVSCTVSEDSSRPYSEPGQIYIHPDTEDSDDYWTYVVRHEVGHSHCLEFRDQTEDCADDWVTAQGWPVYP